MSDRERSYVNKEEVWVTIVQPGADRDLLTKRSGTTRGIGGVRIYNVGDSGAFDIQEVIDQEHRSRDVARTSVLLALESGTVYGIVWGLPNVAKFCGKIRAGNDVGLTAHRRSGMVQFQNWLLQTRKLPKGFWRQGDCQELASHLQVMKQSGVSTTRNRLRQPRIQRRTA
jgi:hypothetical protein